jgi:hypothetical protein
VQTQAERIAANPSIDLSSKSILERVEKRSTDLMAAIIRFFNSTLVYFNKSFFGIDLEISVNLSQYKDFNR